MHTRSVYLALLAFLLCTYATATPTILSTTTHSALTTDPSLKADANFDCPQDCECILAHHTHVPFLHARCKTLHGLKSDDQLKATLPIHSVDLSYLNLTRLSHALEKLVDVTSIDLSHNELHEFGHLGRRIKKLNLKHNRINSSKLSKLPQHVQTLNLQHNEITYLPLEFTKLTQLKNLELAHNDINCSCETLEVRNWLQERHVFMEHPVKCAYPAMTKGKSWLQVKQDDVCTREKTAHVEDDENELMMGDQPYDGSGDMDEEEELGKAFIPVDKKATTAKSAALILPSEVEGSGDLTEMNMPLNILNTSTEEPLANSELLEEDDGEEGSGSGGGILLFPQVHTHTHILDDDYDETPVSKEKEEDDDNDNKPIEGPINPAVFNGGLGIFDGDENRHSSAAPVEEDIIVPVKVNTEGASPPVTDAPDSEGNSEGESVARAKMGENNDDSNATYYLLGVIGLIVVGLLLYVSIKRCKSNSERRNDAENPQTELIDMDKKQLGKPLRNGVPEHIPLIGEKTKSDMAKPISGSKPYDSNDVKDGSGNQDPLLNGNGNANGNGVPQEANDSLHAPHEYYPISPRYPTPQSPRASKYSPQNVEPNNNNNDESYMPASPKTGRYSPVYSPETGRVKIKLTEVPRPKTPMLVTRSRSNAGDIITTPVRPAQTQMETFQPAPVHTNGHTVQGH